MEHMLILPSTLLKSFSEKRTVSDKKKYMVIFSYLIKLIKLTTFVFTEELRKIYCLVLNKLNIDESAGTLRFKKLTLLTGNLKTVYKIIYYF